MDKNISALYIDLVFKDDKANKSLDQFSEKITNIQDQVSKSANAAINSISNVATKLEDSFTNAVKQLGKIDELVTKINKIEIKRDKLGIDEANRFDDKQLLLDFFKDDLEEQYKVHEKIAESVGKENKQFTEIVDHLKSINEYIKTKNKGHDKENSLLNDEGLLWGLIKAASGDQAENILELYQHLLKVVRQVRIIGDAIARASEIQEQFVENTYRLYGSMDNLGAEVRILASWYGLTEKSAVAAYKALADVKTPAGEIFKLSGIVAKMNRVTGVGVETLASYVKSLRTIQIDASKTEVHYGRLQWAMHKYGLTAQELNGIMSDTEVSMKSLEMLLGGSEEVTAFNEMKAAAAGMAKEAGHNAESVTKQFTAMVNDYGTMVLMAGKAGMGIAKSQKDIEAIYLGVADSITEQYNAIKNSDLGVFEKKVQLEVLAKTSGYVSQEAMNAAIAIAELKKKMIAGGTWKGMAGSMKDIEVALWRSYDATQRFTFAWNKFKEALGRVIDESKVFIGLFIVPIIRALTWLIEVISMVISYLIKGFDAIRSLVNMIPIVGPLINDIIGWTYGIIGAMVVLSFTITLLGGPIVRLGGLFGWLGGILTRFTTLVAGAGGSLPAFGASISSFFVTTGNAILSFLRAIQAAATGILALGAALAMTGLGIYLFAQGIAALKDVGWVTITIGIIGFTAAAVALIWALAASAPAAAAATVGLLAIGAAVALIGAGFLMAGYGGKLLIDSFAGLFKVFHKRGSPPFWMMFSVVAAGIVTMAAAAIFGAPFIIMLAGALAVASLASWALAPAFGAIAEVVKELKSESFKEFAESIHVGGKQLLIGSVSLAAASALFVPAAASLLFGSVALSFSVKALAKPAAAIFESGEMIGAGGTALHAGIIKISESSKLLSSVGGEFKQSIGQFRSAIAVLSSADLDKLDRFSNTIVLSGSQLSYGAGLLYDGTIILSETSTLLIQAFNELKDGLSNLDGFDLTKLSKNLADGAFQLRQAAFPLSWAAILIYPAGVLLSKAGAIVFEGGNLLRSGAEQLNIGVKPLFEGIQKVYDISILMLDVAKNLKEGAESINEHAAGLSVALGRIDFRSIRSAAADIDRTAVSLRGATDNLKISVDGFNTPIKDLADIIGLFSELPTKLDRVLNELNAVTTGFVIEPIKLDGFDLGLLNILSTLTDFPDKFSAITTKINNSFKDLTNALINSGRDLSSVDLGDSFGKNIESVANLLDGYASKLEAASERIVDSINNKAIPAIMAAAAAGIEDIATKSEVIHTVQVMHEIEGRDESMRDDFGKMIGLLSKLDEKLGLILGNNVSDDILNTLRMHLPQIADGGSDLSTEFTDF